MGILAKAPGALYDGATSLVDLIRRQFGDDIDGATQELVRMGGFPESVARRIATGELPMDEASRVARREAQTRPETYYNGGNTGGLLEVDPEMSGSARGMSAETGFWGAGDGVRASGYAGNPVTENSTVYPFRVLNNDDQMVVNGQGSNWNLMKDSSPVSVNHWNEGEKSYGAIADWTDDYWDTNSIAHMAKDKGDFDSVLFRNIVDSAGEGSQVHIELMEMFPELKKMPYGSKERKEFLDGLTPEQTSEAYRRAEAKSESMGDSIVVFNPDDVRSPNAAFDPEYTGSNIMGGALAGAVGLGALGQSEDADASVAALARRGLKVIKNGDDYDLIDEATGDYAGKMTTEELLNGNLWSLDTQLNDAYRGQGIGNEYYDAVEEVSGKKMQPSPWLSADGVRFWGRRDPEALANMVRNDEFYDGQNHEQVLGYLRDIEHPGFVDEAPSQVKLRGFRDVFSAAPALAAPALMKDGAFQHGATSEPVAERREPVRNQSGFLADVTDFGDEVFKSVRHAAGPLADVFMPYEGVNNYLKTVNDYDRQPTWWDRLGILDL